MNIARNTVIALVLIVLGLVGYIVYLSSLKPIPVRSNWELKGASDSVDLRWKDPKYSIRADGVVEPSRFLTLNKPSQVIVTREGATTPEIIDGVESIAIRLNGKVYVIRPSEDSVVGFREK